VALLHGCCHNPTGVDPNPEQWKRIAAVIGERRIVPLVDFAYQGMGEGLGEDAAGLQELSRTGTELFVASSFSKNFGLYNERIGALTLIAPTRSAAAKALSHLKTCIRTNYSNPPAHGGAIVSKVLQDEGLRRQWEQELRAMCARISGMRALFAQTLETKGVDRDFSFIRCQRGMFSFSGLSPDQVEALRSRYSIYLVGSGRINVAGMTPANMDYLCSAIAAILRQGKRAEI
jgi:aspartate/tyrosine/aromatic aminotransferase